LAAQETDTGLSRSTSVWLVAMFVAIVIGAVMGLVHLPYAILQPGPARNTLGNGPGGKPLITVTGKTYPTAGALDFTTVAVVGGRRTRSTGGSGSLRVWTRQTRWCPRRSCSLKG